MMIQTETLVSQEAGIDDAWRTVSPTSADARNTWTDCTWKQRRAGRRPASALHQSRDQSDGKFEFSLDRGDEFEYFMDAVYFLSQMFLIFFYLSQSIIYI